MQSNDFSLRQKSSEFKDINSEKNIIAGVLKYDDVLRKCVKELNIESFSSSRNRFLYNSIIEFYRNNNTILDTKALEILLMKKKSKDRNVYVRLWKTILKSKKKIKKSGCIAIIDKLHKLLQARYVEYAIDGSIKRLKKALDGGYDFIDDATKFIKDVTPKLEIRKVETYISNPLDTYEEFKTDHMNIQKNPSLLRSVPTGLKKLDETMGGLRPSEIGLVTAGTGVGKSIMMLDFAYNCFLTTGDILYVTIEMPGSQLRERFYCRMSDIPYDQFRGYKLKKEDFERMDRKIKKFSDEHDHKFSILDIPRSCDVEQLRIEIEEYIKLNGEPKLIIIDYLNILRGGFEWSCQLGIAVGLKQQIARHFKIATWTANQLMGSKHDSENVKVSEMAFAKNLVDNFDVGIGIGLTQEEDIFNISFTKTRDFKGSQFLVHGDRSRMTFQKPPKSKFNSLELKQKKIGGKIII